MQKLISLQNDLAERFDAIVPNGQRSKLMASLIEIEVVKREKLLREAVLAVEASDALNAEMAMWEEATIMDGLSNEAW